MKSSTKVGLLAILLLGGAVVAQTWRLQRERLRVAEANGARQRAVLDAQGWKDAKEATERKLAEVVPALEAQVAAAKAEKIPVIIAGRTVTKAVPFEIPCESHPTPATGGDGAVLNDTSSSPSLPVNLSVDSQFAIAALNDGNLSWTGRLFATMSRGDWKQTKALAPDENSLVIDPKLTKAWRDYVTGPPAVWEARVLLTGPAWGIRAGATWFGRGQHVGVAFDYDRTYSRETSCDYYQESCSSRYVSFSAYAIGAAFRF